MKNNYSVYTSFKAKDGVSGVFKNMRIGALGFSSQLNKISHNAKSVSDSLKSTFGGLKTFVGIATTAIATNTIKILLMSVSMRLRIYKKRSGKQVKLLNKIRTKL